MENTRLPVNRRRFIQNALMSTTAITTLGGVLSACGSTGSSGPTVTINSWDSYVSQSSWMTNEIALFQKANPNIKIKRTLQAVSDYDNLFALAARSHKLPDVAMIPQTPVYNQQIKNGWWMPIDKWADTSWRARFPKGSLHEGSNMFAGKLYSAPFTETVVPFQLYVNTDVFKNAGLVNSDGSVKLPKAWDDVTYAAETIVKKSGGSVYGLGFGNGSWDVLTWWMFVFVIGAGCPGGPGDMDLRYGKYTFSSNRTYQDWLELWKSWKDKGYFYPDSLSIGDEVARAYFERGKFGMTVGGVWDQPEWKQHGFTSYSLTTVITPHEKPDSYFPIKPGGTWVGMTSEAQHTDEAWQWFNWLYSVDAGKRWVQMGEDLSIFPQNDDPKLNPDPVFQQYVATGKLSVPGPDPTVRNPDTAFVTPQSFKPAMSDIMPGYYTGQITNIAASLSQLQQQSQQALTDAIKVANQQGYKVSINDYVFSDWDLLKPYYIELEKH